MSIAVIVPARFGSTRFPGKPLVALRGAGGLAKPLIRRSWEAACGVPDVRVYVATDDARIAEVARAFGAEVLMTPETCANGTERCAAALAQLPADVDLVVNLQGDAPLTPPSFPSALVAAMRRDPAVAVATPVLRATPAIHRRLLDDQQAGRVGGTTAVAAATGAALYFSKAVIPHVPPSRAGEAGLPVFLHVGVYAYTRAALAAYAARPPSALEELEGLEQLRFLDAGVPVRLVEVELGGDDLWEVNNPGDVALVEAVLARRGTA